MNYFKTILSAIFISTLFACSGSENTEANQTLLDKPVAEMTYSETSQALLAAIKDEKETNELTAKLANVSQDALEKELDTDNERLAFWVNVYNANIILILQEHPEYYDDRDTFFKKDQVRVAGELLSFDKIEHGIIRHSTVKLSKGYLRDFFPGEFEKRFRVKDKDPRIHFVLNCGANDCPPVYIYNPTTLDKDFDQIAKAYLNRMSTYDANKQVVTTTPLFNWFTGDWGGKGGVKDFLSNYGIIPEDNNKIDLEFKDYDWTLNIDNFG